jgi:uncharacterized protein YbaR (Trm112 family)
VSILVVCPKCHTRFKVSDKFAGKSGACPKCKGTIRVPTKEEEVQVHTPTEFAGGGRGATGKLALKPIARQETRLQPVAATAVVAAVLAVLATAWIGGGVFRDSLFARAVGLLLVSPPLVIAGYAFLRDAELEPYRGKALYLRTGFCTVAYAVLWGVLGYVSAHVLDAEAWTWLLIAIPLLIAGAFAAFACLDLDFSNGFFHYAFYVLATMLLRWTIGMGWVWQHS